MLLIYAHTDSPRLRYITRFIFNELIPAAFSITTDAAVFTHHDGPKINYSATPLPGTGLHLPPVALLFERGIRRQEITCFNDSGYTAFYRTGGDTGFDIFAATFYLVSRYEEYEPHTTDTYGRYAHTNALAWKEGFLAEPLVHTWAERLRQQLTGQWPAFTARQHHFSFLPTYDIDIAYAYCYKGMAKTLGRLLLEPSSLGRRIRVAQGKEADPFDSYDWLHHLHQEHRLNPFYFFLVAERNGQYDKNILPHQPAMQQLIAAHAARYRVGLHPSWQSGDDPGLLLKEKATLETMAGQSISATRQHYIRFSLPDTYRLLAASGFTDDFSMGYGSVNGFRASVAAPFFWYDIELEQETPLRIHPFCYMDANCYYEQKQTAEQAFAELQQYAATCRLLDAPLCTIWHNNFLGTDPAFAGWRDMYETFLTGLI